MIPVIFFFIIRYISAVIKAFAEDQRCEVKPGIDSQLFFIMFCQIQPTCIRKKQSNNNWLEVKLQSVFICYRYISQSFLSGKAKMAGLTSSALAESPVLMKDTFSLMWQVLLLLQLICTLTLVFSEIA